MSSDDDNSDHHHHDDDGSMVVLDDISDDEGEKALELTKLSQLVGVGDDDAPEEDGYDIQSFVNGFPQRTTTTFVSVDIKLVQQLPHDKWELLLGSFGSIPSLEELTLDGEGGIMNVPLPALCKTLTQASTTLIGLHLGSVIHDDPNDNFSVDFGDNNNMDELAKALESCADTLERFELSVANDVDGASAFRPLYPALAKLTHLENLALHARGHSGSDECDWADDSFFDMIAKTHVLDLRLANFPMTSSDIVEKFQKAVIQNKSLRALVLQGCSVSEEHCKSMAEYITSHSHLEVLQDLQPDRLMFSGQPPIADDEDH